LRGEARRWLSEALWNLETATILYRERRWNAAASTLIKPLRRLLRCFLLSINEAGWGHSVRILLERYFESVGERREDLLMYARAR